MNYILYKNPIQLDTLAIIQYVHNINKDVSMPKYIYERNYPLNIKVLPTIYLIDKDKYYEGIDEIIEFYKYWVPLLTYDEVCKWKNNNKNYRINN